MAELLVIYLSQIDFCILKIIAGSVSEMDTFQRGCSALKIIVMDTKRERIDGVFPGFLESTWSPSFCDANSRALNSNC